MMMPRPPVLSRRAVILGAAACATATAARAESAPDALDREVVAPLLADPARVLDQLDTLGRFVEGKLFGPAFVLMTLRQSRARLGPAALAAVPRLADAVVASIADHLGTRDVVRLSAVRREATWCGMGAVAIAAARDLGDLRHAPIAGALVRALAAEIGGGRDGAPLDSTPGVRWPFDTTPAHVALALWPGETSSVARSAWLTSHVAWVDAHLDPATRLPVSRVTDDGRTLDPPRGCDLSLRVPLLAWVRPATARAWYAAYAEALFSPGFPGGVREWPRGMDRAADYDSGPIVLGVGGTATAFGIAATRAVADAEHEGWLRGRLALARDHACLALALSGGSCTTPDVVAMRAYGDLCAAWACTWTPWAAPA